MFYHVSIRVDGKPTGYKGCIFHRVIKDFMCQSGDFISGDGKGSVSIYGPRFDDENFLRSHSGPGLLSMVCLYRLKTNNLNSWLLFQANSGPNTNGCQFFITCAPADFLDKKHVVFGRVVDGLQTLRRIENTPVGQNNRPKIPVLISQCGEM